LIKKIISKKNIEVQGLIIRIEAIYDEDYVSLTDISKEKGDKTRAAVLIIDWQKK